MKARKRVSAPSCLSTGGDLPRVGRQVRPEFSLICPGYPSRPEIQVLIDRELEHEDDQWLPSPSSRSPACGVSIRGSA